MQNIVGANLSNQLKCTWIDLSFTLKWWAESLAFMSVVYARPLPEVISTGVHGLRVVCHWWLVRSCCDQLEVRCCASLNLSRLRYGCQHCTLAVPQHCPSLIVAKCTRMFNFQEIFKRAFKIYGIWPQAITYVTNSLLQCSPTSVGLTQSRPNYI